MFTQCDGTYFPYFTAVCFHIVQAGCAGKHLRSVNIYVFYPCPVEARRRTPYICSPLYLFMCSGPFCRACVPRNLHCCSYDVSTCERYLLAIYTSSVLKKYVHTYFVVTPCVGTCFSYFTGVLHVVQAVSCPSVATVVLHRAPDCCLLRLF